MSSGSSFKASSGIDCAKKALSFTRSNADARDLLKDLCISISVLIKEGDNYNYIHRSFQEYFAALFLANQRFASWDTVIESILRERSNDSVPRLLLEMDQARFETEFLAPRIKQICAELAQIDVSKTPILAFKKFYLSFSPSKDRITSFLVGSSGVKSPKWTYMVAVLHYYQDAFRGYQHGETDFDWIVHLKSFNKTLPQTNNEIELLEPDVISDALLIGTPMVNYLQGIKDGLQLIERKIEIENNSRQNLLVNVTSRLIDQSQKS